MTEKVVSGTILIFTIVYLYLAKDYTFGSISNPKSGFLPIVVGITAVFLGLINFIKTIKNSSPSDNTIKKLYSRKIIKALLFIIGLASYIFILKITGYAIATFIVLLFLLKVAEVKGWVLPIIVSAGIGGGFYYIFGHLFGVPLP